MWDSPRFSYWTFFFYTSMIFFISQTSCLSFFLLMNNSLTIRVQEDKFLGIIIPENLSWKPHISAVCDRVSKVIEFYASQGDTYPWML